MFEKILVFLTELIENQSYIIFSSLIGLFGTAFGFWSHFYSNKRKELSYTISTSQIIKNNNSFQDEIEIMYKGEKFDSLSVSNFTIWNSGNKMIEASDIALTNPLRISATKDAMILSAKVVNVVEPSNMLVVADHSSSNKERQISFDYLDSKQGAVIQVLHTGNPESLFLDCIIKSGKYNHVEKNRYMVSTKKTMDKYYAPLFLAILVLIHAILSGNNSPFIIITAFLLIEIVLVCIMASFICSLITTQVPSALKTYSK